MWMGASFSFTGANRTLMKVSMRMLAEPMFAMQSSIAVCRSFVPGSTESDFTPVDLRTLHLHLCKRFNMRVHVCCVCVYICVSAASRPGGDRLQDSRVDTNMACHS